MLSIVNAVISILYLFIWAYIFLYITKLEQVGCACSKDWKRSFIKYYIGIIMVLILLRMFSIWTSDKVPAALMTLEILASIGFVVIAYHYIHELKKKKCQCSVDSARDVFEIVNYVQIFMLLLALVIMIHAMVLFSKLSNQVRSVPKLTKKIST